MMSAQTANKSQSHSPSMIPTTSQYDPQIVYVSFRTTTSLQENQQ
jgi:hypothetical protein